MAGTEDEILELDTEVEGEEALETEEQGEAVEGNQADDEVEITFGDEAAPASGERDTDLVKHLRAEIRERDKRLAEVARAPVQRVEVGEKPTLANCDYDEDAFESALDAWKERKSLVEKQETEAAKSAREANEAWANELASYNAKKAALKFADVQEAEETVASVLTQVQRAVIVKAADNPALVEYSLGKHPAKLAELSKINDPIKMAAAVAKLEGTIKMAPRRKAPEPEQIASGSASMAGADKTLERLEKEADRTGDRSNLVAYKRKLREKAK